MMIIIFVGTYSILSRKIDRLDGKFRFISLYPEGKDCTVCSNEIAEGRKQTNFLSLKIAKSKKQYK